MSESSYYQLESVEVEIDWESFLRPNGVFSNEEDVVDDEKVSKMDVARMQERLDEAKLRFENSDAVMNDARELIEQLWGRVGELEGHIEAIVAVCEIAVQKDRIETNPVEHEDVLDLVVETIDRLEDAIEQKNERIAELEDNLEAMERMGDGAALRQSHENLQESLMEIIGLCQRHLDTAIHCGGQPSPQDAVGLVEDTLELLDDESIFDGVDDVTRKKQTPNGVETESVEVSTVSKVVEELREAIIDFDAAQVLRDALETSPAASDDARETVAESARLMAVQLVEKLEDIDIDRHDVESIREALELVEQ